MNYMAIWLGSALVGVIGGIILAWWTNPLPVVKAAPTVPTIQCWSGGSQIVDESGDKIVPYGQGWKVVKGTHELYVQGETCVVTVR